MSFRGKESRDQTEYVFAFALCACVQKSNLDENPNLEQNNNWGGTFNPTMEE